jgi:acetyl esterase/lipase
MMNRMLQWKEILLLACLLMSGLTLAACSHIDAAPQPLTPTIRPKPSETATVLPTSTPQTLNTKPGSANMDLTYCSPDGIPQQMNVFYPKQLSDKLLPVTVYIHGGGWTSGDKGSGAGSVDMKELLARGYLVVSLDYRLAPKYKWPAQITDVKCAIRHLRANAATYKLDPNRIGVWGGSAGGHLVAMLGTTDVSAGFDVGEYIDQSSRVQAVVDLFGPAYLPALLSSNAQLVGSRVFGTTSRDDPILVRASPVTYITPDDPPFLILQGDKDTTVPMEQSQILYDKLKAGGVPATLVIVKNSGHSFIPIGGTLSPSRAELTKMITDFFDQKLR